MVVVTLFHITWHIVMNTAWPSTINGFILQLAVCTMIFCIVSRET
jgi:hypothetical protein